MNSPNAPRSAPSNSSLGQVATQFVLGLPSQERLKAQQEVHKFARWYGEERQLNELSVPEVANYAEQITSSTTEVAEKLGIIKTFLAYAYKQGLTKTNLAVHIKVKKTSSKALSSPGRHSGGTVLLTTEGYAGLDAELTALKNERPRVVEELRKAAADKDFRENAPLEAAREYQGQLEARIRELESTLRMARVMNERQAASHRIAVGDTVVLQDLTAGEQADYTLVDKREADPTKGKISIASPVGQALLGRQRGDRVEVKAPAGILRYLIEDIKQR